MNDKLNKAGSVKATIARLRAQHQQRANASLTVDDEKLIHSQHPPVPAVRQNREAKAPPRPKRASRHSEGVSTAERRHAIDTVTQKLLQGELTQGQALKTLRVEVLGLTQGDYAALVDVSRKTLSDVENDRGSYKTDILNKLFKPFGLRVGIVPITQKLSY